MNYTGQSYALALVGVVMLLSAACAQEAEMSLKFTNHTTGTVHIEWQADPNAEPTWYHSLEPGESYDQPSNRGDLWVIRDDDGNVVDQLTAGDRGGIVNIGAAAPSSSSATTPGPMTANASGAASNPAAPAAPSSVAPSSTSPSPVSPSPASPSPASPSPASPSSTSPSPAASGLSPFVTAGAPSEQLVFHAHNPQALVVPVGNDIVVGWQAYRNGQPVQAVVARYAGAGHAKAWVQTLPLVKLAGLTTDGQHIFALSAVAENLNNDTTQTGYRQNVLQLTKIDAAGAVVWTRDLNSESYLGALKEGQAINGIFSPMDTGTGFLAFGGSQVLVGVSGNTLPDGTFRHQRATFFTVNAADGSGTNAVNTVSWRHSFDQRVVFDGSAFVIMDLGDAGWYVPGGGITLRKATPQGSSTTFTPDRAEGVYVYARQSETAGNQNYTFTSMGDVAPGRSGYLVAFTSEPTNNVSQRSGSNSPIEEPRNVGLVHVVTGFDQVKDGRIKYQDGNTVETTGNTYLDYQAQGGIPHVNVTSRIVDSQGSALATVSRPDKNNMTFTQTGVIWLTQLPTGTSAERPKLARIAEGQYLIAWEEWSYQGTRASYASTKAMLVDESGKVLAAARPIAARLNPSGAGQMGVSNGQAFWVTGLATGLQLHRLDGSLNLASANLQM